MQQLHDTEKRRIFGQEDCLNSHLLLAVTINSLAKLKRFLKGAVYQAQSYQENVSLPFMHTENTTRLHGFVVKKTSVSIQRLFSHAPL